jgi:hypothetical protein
MRGEMRNAYEIFVRKPDGKRLLGMQCKDGRLWLNWKYGMRMWTGFS